LTRAVPETSIAQIGRSFHGFCDRAMAGSSRLYCRRPRDGGVGLHDTIVGYVSPTRLQPGPKLFDADPLRADPRRMTFRVPEPAGGKAMTIQTNATIQPPAADTAARAQEIRRRLPGQARRQRLDTARLEYGPLYSLAEIQQRVAQTLHQKVGFIRRAVFEPIESYQGPIPDEALLKYDAAVQSGLFSAFSVVTPGSGRKPESWALWLSRLCGGLIEPPLLAGDCASRRRGVYACRTAYRFPKKPWQAHRPC